MTEFRDEIERVFGKGCKVRYVSENGNTAGKPFDYTTARYLNADQFLRLAELEAALTPRKKQ